MHAFAAGFFVFVFGGTFATFFGDAFAAFIAVSFEFFIDFRAALTDRCTDRWGLVQIGPSSNADANVSSFVVDNLASSREVAFASTLSVDASISFAGRLG